VESLWLDRALTQAGFVRAVADVLPRLKPKEYFRPAQVDPWGNFNNIAFGKDYSHPRLRLPGTGGIPDVSTYINDILLYVPRHSRLTFVATLDFCSGLGHNAARIYGSGPKYLISDFGQFDFSRCAEDDPEVQPTMRLVTYHPGVRIDKIQAKTGFSLKIAPDVQETAAPTEEELHLLRRVVDPLGIRKLETLSGAERRNLIREIIAKEAIQ
jgi:glutaconate CoA-transferase subunit B